MLRIRQVEVDVNKYSDTEIIRSISSKLKIDIKDILSIKINKQSIDARKKPNLKFILEVDCDVKNEFNVLDKFYKSNDVLLTPDEEYKYRPSGETILNNRPIIVGSGPAGLFCAYMLAKEGYNPLIIERGDMVEKRVSEIDKFWETGKLNTNSNVQFGEGGAGTFSDGKLNTMVKDPLNRGKLVFETFVKCGAPEDIMYVNKPHIGTDILRNVIINLRKKIVSLGGEFMYNSLMTDININNGKVESIVVNNTVIHTDVLVLAIGHSARDTFKMIMNKGIKLESKPFAVGVRISHPQELINISQYGVKNHSVLGNSSYKLTYKASNGRGVYTFCMCPGGYVVNASSEENRLAINGMSYHARDSKNANSAVIVTVNPNDFGNDPLSGIEFQRTLEEKAFKLGNGLIPIQLFKDFKNNVESTSIGSVEPIFKGGYTLSNINNIFPSYISSSLVEGITDFGKKIKGFDNDDVLLAAVESRTSSPVKIIRDDNGVSSVDGIYSCGEGAGYAGGITSAAMDGIKTYEWISNKYKCMS